MNKLESQWLDLRQLDALAGQATFLHRLHPCTKVLTTLAFVVLTASFGKYEFTALLPLCLYPLAVLSLGQIPGVEVARRLLAAAPFVLLVGLFNPLFDQAPVAAGPLVVPGGWLSFLVIAGKLTLTVTAALLLVATTGLQGICAALLQLRLPKALVVQLLFMYRYLHVLLDEFARTLQAYRLRSFHGEGVRREAWGSLLGQLLLRTLARAERIYQAMRCRGFDGEVRLSAPRAWGQADLCYLAFWLTFFSLCRAIHLPQLLGGLLTGGLP